MAHEYVISLAIGKFKIFALMSFGLQYAYILWETYLFKVLNLENTNFGNFMFWVNCCVLGQPILGTIYYLCYINHM